MARGNITRKDKWKKRMKAYDWQKMREKTQDKLVQDRIRAKVKRGSRRGKRKRGKRKRGGL